jgi:preprotein translocase subunit SecD
VGGPHDGASTLSPGTGTAIAGLCLLAVAAIVAYGLYIIIA